MEGLGRMVSPLLGLLKDSLRLTVRGRSGGLSKSVNKGSRVTIRVVGVINLLTTSA